MNQLPHITADYYRSAIHKFAQEENNKPNPDKEYLSLLGERGSYADGLVHIIPVQEPLGYILAYENRYIFKLATGGFMFMLHMANSNQQKIDVAVDYLLRKTHWFSEFANTPRAKPAYDALAAGMTVHGSNSHVDFFRVRFGVQLARFFDVNKYLPEGVKYTTNGSFIICYGKGTEGQDFNYQFEIYLNSLLELLTPGISDERLVGVFCKILSNEVSVITGQLRLDVMLVDRVQKLMQQNPRVVNEGVNAHLARVKKMPQHGLEMAGCTLSMLRQMLPTLRVTALTPAEESQFAGFVSSSDRRAVI